MKRTLVLLLIGIAAPMVQGAANTFIPARFTPDLGFLIVIALVAFAIDRTVYKLQRRWFPYRQIP